ncbi:MAG: hypothetical protein DA408_12050 [Bacteroidetes bacterium]|nr:MAG: hypothetical protein C7N36_06355 [Bacteroidota bacterium]PTM12093.1 MAG: hypothetical protein DA408_12050 [Bacteroidota bacterium]
MEQPQPPVNFSPLLTLVKIIYFLCLAGIGYLTLGDTIYGWLHQPQPVPAEAQQRRATATQVDDYDKVVDGIHVQTGLIFAQGFEVVRGTCTACHSAKLVTQNRATRDGWLQMIRWMQASQGLWDLGDNEPIILDYLATNYAPEDTGRRANLDVAAIEWYILELN